MLKFGAPLIILFTAGIVSLWVISYFFTLRLDFSKVFVSAPTQPPQPTTGGVSVRLNGTAGDSAIIGFQFPTSASSSENIQFQGKNLTEIEAGLNKIETDELEFLTSLPSSVFRFNVFVVSYPSSPNNAKKASYFLVTDPDGTSEKILPGQSIKVVENAHVADLQNILAGMNVHLIYENGMYQNFYDREGNLVSQATGELVIKPTVWVQWLIFFGIWAFIVAALTLAKQTLLSSQDVAEVINFLKAP